MHAAYNNVRTCEHMLQLRSNKYRWVSAGEEFSELLRHQPSRLNLLDLKENGLNMHISTVPLFYTQLYLSGFQASVCTSHCIGLCMEDRCPKHDYLRVYGSFKLTLALSPCTLLPSNSSTFPSPALLLLVSCFYSPSVSVSLRTCMHF